MPPAEDRRFEPRLPAPGRALIVAPGMELPCRVMDASGSGRRIQLDRQTALPKAFVLVELSAGTASDASLAWSKGREAGLKISGSVGLKGLTPSRFTAAREAWLRHRA